MKETVTYGFNSILSGFGYLPEKQLSEITKKLHICSAYLRISRTLIFTEAKAEITGLDFNLCFFAHNILRF
jgi:hypothetical protein